MSALSEEQIERYSRHIILPEIGGKGQKKLLGAKVLVVGAGGLGSPVLLYLAAAGVGKLGIIDMDVVDNSNLQRQIIHSLGSVGMPKVESARKAIEGLNPDVTVITYEERLSKDNIERILDEGYDLLIDGCDNFATRYLINDACYFKKVPNIHGSVFRFEGQVTVFAPDKGPCYRCLYPSPPPPGMVPSCHEAGVLGVLPGIIGILQSIEAVKLLIPGLGDPLIGRLLLVDTLTMDFNKMKLERDPECPLCGDNRTITTVEEYDDTQVCSI